MRPLKVILAVIVAIVVGGGVLLLKAYWWETWQTAREQSQYDEFYAVPDPVTGAAGDVIRSEAAPDWDVEGAQATRILYVTETVSGEKRVSSGMVWIPEKEFKGERNVLAWAHPTVGYGNACVPSRRAIHNGPFNETWLTQMVADGWVVTGTDYTGMGTQPQPQTYLVGEQEARDVINSVRAARSMDGVNAGKQWGVYGHSQGGHAALWTANTAKKYAPELELVGAAAAAPAADLRATLEQQWDKSVSWEIGPEIAVSWPLVYPDLEMSIISPDRETVVDTAYDCAQVGKIFGTVRQDVLGERFFNSNPLENQSWAKTIEAETPKPPAPDVPIHLSEGTDDQVVLPNATAALQEEWCKAGVDLTTLWLGNVWHMLVAQDAGPEVVSWFADRFEGKPTASNCDSKPPIAPYRGPTETPSSAPDSASDQ